MNDRILFSDHSWKVEFLPEEGAILVETTDYHAKPLKIPLDRWLAFAGQCGLVVPEAAPPAERAQGVAVLDDLAVIVKKDVWTVSVSKRDKSALVACAGCAVPPLALSRGELYRIGKSMGKRGGGSRVR